MTRRTEQVGSLLQKELGELMLGLELPAMTTISRVVVTEDLKHAKVWITVFSENASLEKEVLSQLDKQVFELQGEINRRLKMHHAPRISFGLDNSEHYASRINELLKRTHEDEK